MKHGNLEKGKSDNPSVSRNRDIYYVPGIFFILTFSYFKWLGGYLLFFQETQSLFLFTGDYLHRFLIKPGGLLEYAAKFLTQFYAGNISGSVIVSVVLTLPGLIIYFINKRLIPGITISLLYLLIPSLLMLLLQANYYHMMEYNLGFLMIFAYYLFSLSSGKKLNRILGLVLFPLFYYIAGAYALIFAGVFIIHGLFIEKGIQRYIYMSVLLIIAAITFLIFSTLIFLQPARNILFFPLPVLNNIIYKVTFFILCGYVVLYPLICRMSMLLTGKRLNNKTFNISTIAIIISLAIFMLFKIYNPETARVVEMQKLIFEEKWEEAINFQQKEPSRNLISEYYFNIALSETDQLCDKLFTANQDFGPGALVLPWGDEHLNRGAYFYYTIGLINEAHRWAYEEMVVYGYRPQNINMLAKTSLINGDYRMARKYINILKQTIYYRGLAKKYEKMANNPELISSDPDLGVKLKLIPKNNFFIQFNEPQNNLPLLLEGMPDNKRAFEYYIAGLLLTKNVENLMYIINKMKGIGYTQLPRHIEEAILIYYNSQKKLPDMGGLTINPATVARFDQYFTTFMANREKPAVLKEKMKEQFGNTFWYYFHFN